MTAHIGGLFSATFGATKCDVFLWIFANVLWIFPKFESTTKYHNIRKNRHFWRFSYMVRVTRLEVSLFPYFIGIYWQWCNSNATDTEKAPWHWRIPECFSAKGGLYEAGLIFFDNNAELCFISYFDKHISIAL